MTAALSLRKVISHPEIRLRLHLGHQAAKLTEPELKPHLEKRGRSTITAGRDPGLRYEGADTPEKVFPVGFVTSLELGGHAGESPEELMAVHDFSAQGFQQVLEEEMLLQPVGQAEAPGSISKRIVIQGSSRPQLILAAHILFVSPVLLRRQAFRPFGRHNLHMRNHGIGKEFTGILP